MQGIKWAGKPGGKNEAVEIDHGLVGDYYFSLCNRQDSDDQFLFRLFVYRSNAGGFLHVGGYNSHDEARAAADKWEDPYPGHTFSGGIPRNTTVGVELTNNELLLLYRQADQMCRIVEQEKFDVKVWHIIRDKITKSIEHIRST